MKVSASEQVISSRVVDLPGGGRREWLIYADGSAVVTTEDSDGDIISQDEHLLPKSVRVARYRQAASR